MKNIDRRVAARVAEMQRKDPKLGAELERRRADPAKRKNADEIRAIIAPQVSALESTDGRSRDERVASVALETIVLATGRPVLAIKKGTPQLVFTDEESEVWKERLQKAQKALAPVIKAIGRVELVNNPRYEWVGTGWLVADDVIVTNRHVAREFGRGANGAFQFRMGIGGQMGAAIDFLEEIDDAASASFKCLKVMHIEDEDGPDVAFLRVARTPGKLASPVELSRTRAMQDQHVAVIGYPARDSRIPDAALMDRIFGNVYDKKRLAPGQVTGSEDDELLHDCSTLGGNSGSAVVDLASGAAVGLHFAGRWLEANYAVPAHVVAERLRVVTSGSRRRSGANGSRRGEDAGGDGAAAARIATAGVGSTVVGRTPNSVTRMYPVYVTVTIGDDAGGTAAPSPGARAGDGAATVRDGDDEIDIDDLERAMPEDYEDREGYDPAFLGDGLDVALPRIAVARRADVLRFQEKGRTASVLRYTHFSVVMSRSRRLCFFSAVNIDGSQSRKGKRPGWRLDPRIPDDAQIIAECYGNEPKFSRGHMTRREDPIWGEPKVSKLGNADSMHATNAVPQMQPFNAGIWLGLEDYALENARQDDMRISVFTGPFLLPNDPIRFGVKIPRSFWKVIAFVHDETRELCATGYTMSQRDFLREEEFVFGAHETSQVPIATIQSQSGVSFGDLASVDPMAGAVEEAAPPRLTSFEQIRFR